jgi:hypothetical protein
MISDGNGMLLGEDAVLDTADQIRNLFRLGLP